MQSTLIPPAILAERQRQVSGEGYDSRHDDEHVDGELLAVARMYWQRGIGIPVLMRPDGVPVGFPWLDGWWKPKGPRRDLERAGALCLAEIDRLNRAGRDAAPAGEQLEVIVSAYNALPSFSP